MSRIENAAGTLRKELLTAHGGKGADPEWGLDSPLRRTYDHFTCTLPGMEKCAQILKDWQDGKDISVVQGIGTVLWGDKHLRPDGSPPDHPGEDWPEIEMERYVEPPPMADPLHVGGVEVEEDEAKQAKMDRKRIARRARQLEQEGVGCPACLADRHPEDRFHTRKPNGKWRCTFPIAFVRRVQGCTACSCGVGMWSLEHTLEGGCQAEQHRRDHPEEALIGPQDVRYRWGEHEGAEARLPDGEGREELPSEEGSDPRRPRLHMPPE